MHRHRGRTGALGCLNRRQAPLAATGTGAMVCRGKPLRRRRAARAGAQGQSDDAGKICRGGRVGASVMPAKLRWIAAASGLFIALLAYAGVAQADPNALWNIV